MASIFSSIPPSESDRLLRSWGYDLTGEYEQIVGKTDLPPQATVLELATGTGRMTSVLTRLGFHVVTGDLELGQRHRAEERITNAYLPLVQFLRLNVESLPFQDHSIPFLVCMNTLHELANPQKAFSELIRVHDPRGVLIIGDFNETGFGVMERLHQVVYAGHHSLGTMPMKEAEPVLQSQYRSVHPIETPLNISFVASGALT